MKYSLEYFNRRVLDDLEAWPAGILAAYARSAELLSEFGPLLRKTQSIPESDLKLAERRMKKVHHSEE